MTEEEIDYAWIFRRLLSTQKLNYQIKKEIWNNLTIEIFNEDGVKLDYLSFGPFRPNGDGDFLFICHRKITNDDYKNILMNMSGITFVTNSWDKDGHYTIMKYDSIPELILKLDLMGA